MARMRSIKGIIVTIVVVVIMMASPVSGFSQVHPVTLPNIDVWDVKLISDDFFPQPLVLSAFSICNAALDPVNSKIGLTEEALRLPKIAHKGLYAGTDIKAKKGHVKFLTGIRLNCLITKVLPKKIRMRFQVFNIAEPNNEFNFQKPLEITFTPEMINEDTWGLYYELPEPIELPQNARIMEEWVEISDFGTPIYLARNTKANSYDEWSATARKKSSTALNLTSFRIMEFELPKKEQLPKEHTNKNAHNAHLRETLNEGDY